MSADPGIAMAPADNGGVTKTILLTSTSSAIDTAQLSTCPTDDQRGLPRPGANGLCDVGAIEIQ